ncbi:MAG: SpvB/TcaC N-terminal domain-containing protein [Thiolinea sp.]
MLKVTIFYTEHIKDSNQNDNRENRSFTQTYIRRILYGNTSDDLPDTQKVGLVRTSTTDHHSPLNTLSRHYLFEVLFDYQPVPLDDSPAISAFPGHGKETQIPTDWEERADCFSSFRSGFEIRTRYRCSRVLMRHHFNEGELAGAPLVKSTDFHYEVNPRTQLSFLKSASVSGYRKRP